MNSFINLSKFLFNEKKRYISCNYDFAPIIEDIAFVAKIISREVNKAGLVNILGAANTHNIHGETQQKLDLFANDKIIETLKKSGHVCAMASEENDEMINVEDEYRGNFAVVFDPLDGSSNIDVNVSIGTIFGIYKKIENKSCINTLLQQGKNLVAAGYVIYGSSTMLVYTAGHGVHGFTLDQSLGEFMLSHKDIKIPKYGKIYSINESNYNRWTKGIQEYVNFIKNHPERQYTARWIGSFVADFHRNMLKGGVFLYTEDSKNTNGKLRLLYEANPMAFIIQQAGGKAISSNEEILNITPSNLHQRIPLIIGSQYEVELYKQYREKYG